MQTRKGSGQPRQGKKDGHTGKPKTIPTKRPQNLGATNTHGRGQAPGPSNATKVEKTDTKKQGRGRGQKKGETKFQGKLSRPTDNAGGMEDQEKGRVGKNRTQGAHRRAAGALVQGVKGVLNERGVGGKDQHKKNITPSGQTRPGVHGEKRKRERSNTETW